MIILIIFVPGKKFKNMPSKKSKTRYKSCGYILVKAVMARTVAV
jgi:hypothetical protein